jgi:hypothetical protein
MLMREVSEDQTDQIRNRKKQSGFVHQRSVEEEEGRRKTV